MARVRVQVLNEVGDDPKITGKWELQFQWCRYIYDDGSMEYGYRFIWRRLNGSLQAARGQAQLPSVQTIYDLIERAKAEGWGDYDAYDLKGNPL